MASPLFSFKNIVSLWRQRIPEQLIIQFTDKCNARCPQCGMRITNKYKRTTLPMDDIKRIIDAAGERNVKAVSFTGGEPLLYLEELADLIKYAGRAGIEYIRTGTNGFHFRHPDKPDFEARIRKVAETLANTPVRNFWISIDSAIPKIHEEMRGLEGVIKGIEKGLPIFHEYGLYPSANLGINRNVGGAWQESYQSNPTLIDKNYLQTFYEDYRQSFQNFYRHVIDLGFTIVNACYPMSIDETEIQQDGSLEAVYVATSEDYVVKYRDEEKPLLFKALMDTIPEFRSKIRIFSPRISLYALYKQYTNHPDKPYPCRGGVDFFFIDSKDGNTYPCGYRGNENLGKYWDVDWKSIDRNFACYQCDWECFRDPSEMLGPLQDALSNPLRLIRKFQKDSLYFKIWREDLRYYRACEYFDGRKPMTLDRLRQFADKTREYDQEIQHDFDLSESRG